MSDDTIEKVATHPARQAGLRVRYSEAGRQRHQQRAMVEELFGIGKDLFPGFADLQWFQAGVRRVREHFRWVLCAFTLVLLRNLRHDEPFLGLKMVLD